MEYESMCPDNQISPLYESKENIKFFDEKSKAINQLEKDKWHYKNQWGSEMNEQKTKLKNAAMGSVLAEGVNLISSDEFKAMSYEAVTSLIKSRLKDRMERMPPMYHHDEADYWDFEKGDDSKFVCYQYDIQEIKKPLPEKVSLKEVTQIMAQTAAVLMELSKKMEMGIQA
jgi:hypothetical protein